MVDLEKHILKTNKRARLGVWGLGRGLRLGRVCRCLNIDVVAGCDNSPATRAKFQRECPEAMVTDDPGIFLNTDIDAVLLATYCPAHAEHAIACLDAGKHVLSEVTAFHTMAEGVRLVEAAERNGRIYHLAENYPYSKNNMYLAMKWREGLFGELQYGEYEYVHDIRSFNYHYNHEGHPPIMPGHTVHNWRSWMDSHYYCTHSLGPIMHITGRRPVRVVALPSTVHLAGTPGDKHALGRNGVASSLINMDNGAVVRNLMGETTNDSMHGGVERLWGTRGAAEVKDGEVSLRLGGTGKSNRFAVASRWPCFADHAEATGHDGGDFWVMYNFAKHLLLDEPGFFDVYTAADCTIPGILAYRSAYENGQPFDVPDFRDPTQREAYRNDTFAQARYNAETGCFAPDADRAITGQFTTLMTTLYRHVGLCRGVIDWSSLITDVRDTDSVRQMMDEFITSYTDITANIKAARSLANTYPDSDGARMIREMLDLADADQLTQKDFLKSIIAMRDQLRR